MTHRTRTLIGVAIAGFMLASPVAVAQDEDAPPSPSDLRPPQPTEDPSAPTFTTIAVCVLLGGGLVFASIFPSKRGHQD